MMIDLFVLVELFERIQFKTEAEVEAEGKQYQNFDTVLSWLSYLLKHPKSESGITSINSLSRQRTMLENLVKVCAGLSVDDNLRFDVRILNQNIYQK